MTLGDTKMGKGSLERWDKEDERTTDDPYLFCSYIIKFRIQDMEQ